MQRCISNSFFILCYKLNQVDYISSLLFSLFLSIYSLFIYLLIQLSLSSSSFPHLFKLFKQLATQPHFLLDFQPFRVYYNADTNCRDNFCHHNLNHVLISTIMTCLSIHLFKYHHQNSWLLTYWLTLAIRLSVTFSVTNDIMSVSVATKVFLISTSAIPISYLLNRFIEKTGLTQPLLIVFLCHIIGLLIFSFIVKCTKHALHKNNEYIFYSKYHKSDFCFFLSLLIKIFITINQFILSFFSAFALICFVSVSSLIIALELEGLISGFTNSFLKHVEPHLRSSFGAMICHWNGIVTNALALMIIAAITWR